jgi:hypothetical protein
MTPATLQSTVVSLVPFEINEFKPGLFPPKFEIPKSDMVTPQVIHIGTGVFYVYLDESRGSFPVRTPSEEIARSIVEDYSSAQLSISGDDPIAKPALFWLPGTVDAMEVKVKYMGVCKTYLQYQKQWFLNMCALADDDWKRYQRHTAISDVQRTAASILGWRAEEHPWMSLQVTLESERCPACQMLVSPGVVICPNCKCVLDSEKFKELQFTQ